MQLSKFYNFKSKLQSNCFRATPVFSSNTNYTDAELVESLVSGENAVNKFPITFKQQSGSKLFDLLDTGWVGLFLVSQRIAEIIEMNQLTGYRLFEIELYTKKEDKVSGYFGLSIVGRSGPLKYNVNSIIEKRTVPNGPTSKFYVGQYIDANTWDGSDFFLSEGNKGIKCSQNVVEKLSKVKLTHIYFEDLSTVEVWDKIVESHNKKF